VVALGKVGVQPIHDWVPGPGSVVSWHPSSAALAKARQAPISAVPASYMQARHLRGYCEHASQRVDMARLCIAAWDIPGRCDIRAMTYVINAHLRRHDTYHSWFEYKDAEHIVRHTIPDPTDIELVPTEHGEMTPAEWRSHILATPDPLHWACFRFMLIQRADHFTFCVCVDHLHVDAVFISVVFMEIHMMYAALAGGAPPIPLPDAGSYNDFCVRHHRYISALTLESPQVRAWIEFAENNDGTLPNFPLPLGDPSVPWSGAPMTVQLLDEQQTARFESACIEAGTRFSGGVFACAALAEHELTGAETYYGLTPVDTRSTPADFLTLGWFSGLIPITVPVAATSFDDTARAAQASFDSSRDLANVPFDRVLELAPWLSRPRPFFPVLFYLDAGIPPLSAVVTSQLGGVNTMVYHDGGVPAQFGIRVNRLPEETQVIVLFPNNPVARESATRYIAALKSVYVRVAEGRGAAAPARNAAQPVRQPA
jgi:mycolipenoyl-CoA---2-(long-chain-fatty acyl)-trehalose mycolipenoyltransferase / long-chain-acyl-CoA---trehalose acyltransferase